MRSSTVLSALKLASREAGWFASEKTWRSTQEGIIEARALAKRRTRQAQRFFSYLLRRLELVDSLDAENQAMMNQIDDLATKVEAVEAMPEGTHLAHDDIQHRWEFHQWQKWPMKGATPWQALNVKEEK